MKKTIENRNIKQLFNKKIKQNKQDDLNKILDNLDIKPQLKKFIIDEYNLSEQRLFNNQKIKISIEDFIPLKIIGKGAFGEVRICKWKENNQIVAIKKLKKSEIISKNQINHLIDERNILIENQSNWVVDLKCCFTDEIYLYIVMEYLPGGDLMSLLIKKNRINEKIAKFYISEILQAVESVHNLNYIHRDLKPDNIVIGKDGHLKWVDFGLCSKFNINHNYNSKNNEKNNYKNRRNCLKSLVGTPDYIAPEVFDNFGYNQTCDFWSLGVILYEMVIGYPPFISKSQDRTYFKIINWDKYLKFPKEITLSREIKDLIFKLISSPENRLGSKGINEIKSHPFFKDINWSNLRNIKPPFVPRLSSNIDNKYFDKFKENKLWGYNKNFYKFKFKEDLIFSDFTYKKSFEIERNKFFKNFIDTLKDKVKKYNFDFNKENVSDTTKTSNNLKKKLPHKNTLKRFNTNKKIFIKFHSPLLKNKENYKFKITSKSPKFKRKLLLNN